MPLYNKSRKTFIYLVPKGCKKKYNSCTELILIKEFINLGYNILPVYNLYLTTVPPYEDVISNPSVPEYVLPNVYMFQAELQNTGRIENSFNIPRGLLEFWIHPESAYVKKEKLDLNKELVLFCAAGGRSALAAKTLQDMGFEKVSHIDGGFALMKNTGFKTK